MFADQPHVVRQRHPTEADVVGIETRRRRRTPPVRNDVAVREHDTLRFTGRAGRELNECNIARRGALDASGAADVFELVGQERASYELLAGRLLADAGSEG